MTEEIYFLDEGQIKITAASIGISRQQWTSISENEIDSNKHIELMATNRYDQLPIESKNGIVTDFFKTAQPNTYDNIERHSIRYYDIIPLDTNIRDVIEKFASNKRSFYFLNFHKTISGIITLANLNCKQVQVYIFSLICELERELSNFINNHLTREEIKDWIKSKEDKNNPEDKYRTILENFKKLEDSELDNQLTEHFFFTDFFNIIKDKTLFNQLDFSASQWRRQSSINELRKRIAHPTRSLLDKDNDVFKLKKRLEKTDDLLFKLITYRKKTAANG